MRARLSLNAVGTALVGLGKVAAAHAEALASLPESHFVGVFDSDPHRTSAFAERYEVRAYQSLTELLNDPLVDAVSLCTPHPAHAATAIECLASNRHVLVEKPMATTLAECDAMIAAADDRGVRLGMVSQRRFYPSVRRVREALDAGRIGRPILGTLELLGWRGSEYYAMDAWRGTWAGEGGGLLVNQATHLLDLFQWFMGPLSEVDAYVANLSHPAIEVDDSAVAIARFANGALGSIVASNSQYPGLFGRIHIHGDSGLSIGVQTETGSSFVAGVSSDVALPFNDLWTIPGEGEAIRRWRGSDRRQVRGLDVTHYYHRLQIEDFLRAVLDDRDPCVSGREGRKTVELITALYRAERTGRRVVFPLLPEEADLLPPFSTTTAPAVRPDQIHG